ncbi:MAG: F0F1 ATP synthase subunit alpha [Oscillospiraceae bacterium]|nr:F0F1 ATP synthase subunit alpha [Oscillospiraceae bacterium]
MGLHFLYACINTLIIAALIFIIGRKMISKMFNGRREKICRELDELEAPTETPKLPEETSAEQPAAADSALIEETVAKINSAAKSEIEQLDKQHIYQINDIRRDMVTAVRADFLEKLRAEVIKVMSAEPYVSLMRAKESIIADRIIDAAELSPGDIAYLESKDVLYVTLTSAFPLSQDIVDKISACIHRLLYDIGGKPSFWVRVDSSLIGGLRLRIGDTVYDYSVDNMLYRAVKHLTSVPMHYDSDIESIIDSVTADINALPDSVDEFQLGRVISISDGICWLDGLSDIMYGELVEFECGERGMILDIEPSRIGCIVFGRYEHLESGSKVRRVGRMARVPVGEELLGRIVDPLGTPIDGKGNIWATNFRPIETRAPGIPDRKSVSKPLHTGIKAIDALVPIGRGQRELIIGDRQTGKSSIAIDAIINQKGKDVICIYVSIGQKETTVAELRSKLEKYGAMEYTIIVSATASSSASMQYIAPFSATAIGEYFMYSGRDVLIVYDDLSKHAVSYRELSLLLHRPTGRESYPGDIFYLHSRLLERSARLSDELGGGSMTALPIIETQAGDISAYIPTNVISITDGQIFLETDLFNEGQRPAINVGLSVSRVGSAAQTKLMKQVSSQLRMTLAQHRELASFAQFGSDLDDTTRRILDSGDRMLSALRQGRYSPLPDAQQALIIFAVGNGFADKIAPTDIERFEEALFRYFDKNCADIMEELETGSKMSDELIEKLREQLGCFTANLTL